MEKINLDEVVGFLNSLIRLDAKAMKGLVESRVPCNEHLSAHETVQVLRTENGTLEVGVLGLLNGLIGIHDSGWGYLSVELDEYGNLLRFLQTPKTK